MKLFKNDYVLFNGKECLTFACSTDIIIYGDKEDAEIDNRFAPKYNLVRCTDLPLEVQETLLKQ